jgi:glycosyltransferase involved in cell wall biosynthesis
MSRPLRLLTIGHSYVVASNRLLAHAMAVAGDGEWQVTAVAPRSFPGDLRTIEAEPIAGERCALEPVPVHLPRPPQAMLYGRRLREILRRDWDVVHCWEEPYVAAAAQVARWAPSDSVLVFASFQNLPKRYPPPFGWMERFAMRRADGWIAFGQTVEATLSARPMYQALPHATIPPGVDLSLFRPDPDARLRLLHDLGWTEDGTPVVGFLGRFVPAKGLRVLTAALDRVPGPWRALFVGGGEMEGELRAWARGRDEVRVVTGVPHGRVPEHLAAMDVLCAPSLTTPRWREQFGRMLVEAFACGVPVIGSDSGEIPHVLGDAGIVMPEGDAGALAQAIAGLLSDPVRRADLARRGLDRARAEFSTGAAARRHLAFFRDLLRSKHGGEAGNALMR